MAEQTLQSEASGKVFLPAAIDPVEPQASAVPTPNRPSVKERKPRKLTTRQAAFVHHYADPTKPTFGNARRSYAASHPDSHSVNAHGVDGHRTLNNAIVREQIEAELKAWGYDKSRLEHELALNLQSCREGKQWANHRAAIETLAKLRGDWKERSEIESISHEQKDTIRRLVNESLSTASSQPNVNGERMIGKPVDNSMGQVVERETDPHPTAGAVENNNLTSITRAHQKSEPLISNLLVQKKI